MKYTEYEKALSIPRLEKYKKACNGDKNKALILYRYNIKLCQKFYGVLGVLEVTLRNAIDTHYRNQFDDNEWIISQATNGFLTDYQDTIFKERDKLLKNDIYTHDKLISSLSFGVWTFMFSRKCYKNAGKTLLKIFPNKTPGLNQKDIYEELDKIRLFRNRIAHHEHICFNSFGDIGIDSAKYIYNLMGKYIEFMGYSANNLFYGVDTPVSMIDKIHRLTLSI